MIPNDLEGLDGMLVGLAILLTEHREHARLIENYWFVDQWAVTMLPL